MRDPWLTIPGVQNGERTLEEQLLGLDPALKAAAGKSVIDFGCAEGLIGLEFLKHGAVSLVGYDLRGEFLVHAAEQSRRQGVAERCRFREYNLAALCQPGLPDDLGAGPGADIVLALAIVHKLRNPGQALKHMADLANERVAIRLPLGSTGRIACKFDGRRFCDSHAVMRAAGFVLEADLAGPRGERVHHWVRR